MTKRFFFIVITGITIFAVIDYQCFSNDFSVGENVRLKNSEVKFLASIEYNN